MFVCSLFPPSLSPPPCLDLIVNRGRHGAGSRRDLMRIERKLHKMQAKKASEERRLPTQPAVAQDTPVAAPARRGPQRGRRVIPADPRAFLELFAKLGMTEEFCETFDEEDKQFHPDWNAEVRGEVELLKNLLSR